MNSKVSSRPEATASLDCQAHNPQLGTQMRSQALKQSPQMVLGVQARALGLCIVLNLAGNCERIKTMYRAQPRRKCNWDFGSMERAVWD